MAHAFEVLLVLQKLSGFIYTNTSSMGFLSTVAIGILEEKENMGNLPKAR